MLSMDQAQHDAGEADDDVPVVSVESLTNLLVTWRARAVRLDSLNRFVEPENSKEINYCADELEQITNRANEVFNEV